MGGGAAAVSILDSLQQNCTPGSVTLIEPGHSVGPGRAYQPDIDSALLNQVASRMSLRGSEPGHFVQWLSKHQEKHSGEPWALPIDGFVSRHLFGEYLSTNASRLINNGDVTVIQDTVTAVRENPGDVSVSLTKGAREEFDQVILCTGTGAPTDVYGLAKEPGYVHDPYPLGAQLSRIDRRQSVAVLGTGLTAVDVVVALLSGGHTGAIIMASRSGLLPAVRSFSPADRLRYLNSHALAEGLRTDPHMSCARLLKAVRQELLAAGLDLTAVARDLSAAEPAHRRLSRQVSESQNDDAPWQPILIRAAIESIELLWNTMPARERDRFMSRWHRVFNSLINPMPPRTAHHLLTAMDTGQLHVHDRISSVQPGKTGFVVTTGQSSAHVNYLVNAIRKDTGVTNSVSMALVDGLVADGTARMHPYGGIDISPSSNRIIDRAGIASARMFALGQLTCGVHYYTSSMTMITRRASVIADELAKVAVA